MSVHVADAAVIAALPAALSAAVGMPVDVQKVWRLGGGASKEAWAVDAVVQRQGQGQVKQWLVRRMGGGVLHDHTVSLATEHAVIRAAHAAGVPVPRPLGFIADLAGRDAFVMDRVGGEGVGRRIVRDLNLDTHAQAARELPRQMAAALAGIHRISRVAVPELPAPADRDMAAQRTVAQLERKLDEAGEPHPAIELGLQSLRRRISDSGADQPHDVVLVHGDFRLGNLLVDEAGLVAVIDWEFAHWGHALEDLAWPLVRAWRFGRDDRRLGGVGDLVPYLTAYNEAAGTTYTPTQLAWWELAGNVRWAITCLTQARRHLSGAEPNVELAVLGRLACEVEHEILHLLLRQQARETGDAGQA